MPHKTTNKLSKIDDSYGPKPGPSPPKHQVSNSPFGGVRNPVLWVPLTMMNPDSSGFAFRRQDAFSLAQGQTWLYEIRAAWQLAQAYFPSPCRQTGSTRFRQALGRGGWGESQLAWPQCTRTHRRGKGGPFIYLQVFERADSLIGWKERAFPHVQGVETHTQDAQTPIHAHKKRRWPFTGSLPIVVATGTPQR